MRLALYCVSVVLSGVVALPACGDDVAPASSTESHPVRVLSYNLVNAGGEDNKGAVIAAHIDALAPDLVGVQECAACDDWLQDKLGEPLETTLDLQSGVAVLYASERWLSKESGVLSLGLNDDGWGERVA